METPVYAMKECGVFSIGNGDPGTHMTRVAG